MRARGDGRRGLADLLRELADGSTRLMRQEVRLARLEVRQLFAEVGRGTTQVAAGSVLLLIGVMALFTGIILLVGDAWLRDRYWLAALIVTVVLGIIAAWLARRGVALLSPAKLAPDQTVETLREDKEWLRRRLTSGATSS